MIQPEDYNLGDSLSESCEDYSKEVRGEASIYVTLTKGYMQSGTHLGRRLLHSRGTDILVNVFSAFLSMGRCRKLDS